MSGTQNARGSEVELVTLFDVEEKRVDGLYVISMFHTLAKIGKIRI